jgi:glycosyltransferase involved in cell wall biosynthesis
MNQASVTVCIPTRNRSALLASAIKSVLAQSFPDLVLLVSDNASTDDTATIVQRIDDPRLRYVRHDTDVGPTANFNACLQAADCEYVLLLCDDDVLHPQFLEAAVKALRSDQRVGFAFTTWRRRSDDGTIDDRVINESGLTQATTLPGPDYIGRAIRKQGSIAHTSSVLMRKTAIPPAGFDQRDGFAMDVGLLLRIAAQWDVAFLPAPLVFVRLEPDSLTGRVVGLGPNGRVRWDLDADVKRWEVKMRFLDGPGRSLANAAELRRTVAGIFHRRVMWHSASALRGGGHLRSAWDALAKGVAVDTSVLWDPYAWRVGLAALAGPALTQRLRALRT